MYAVFIPVGTANDKVPVPSLNLAEEVPILGLPQLVLVAFVHVPVLADGLVKSAVESKLVKLYELKSWSPVFVPDRLEADNAPTKETDLLEPVTVE